jgi:hypothetical protein
MEIMNNLPKKIDQEIKLYYHRHGYLGIRRKTPRNYDRLTYSLSLFEVMSGFKKNKPIIGSGIPSDEFDYTKLVEPISAMTITIFRNGRNFVRANPYIVNHEDLKGIFEILWRDAEKQMEMI